MAHKVTKKQLGSASTTLAGLPMQPLPVNRQAQKSARTRQIILQATIDCIYELGYSLTTTEKVAAKAEVSRGAMLHHFPTRKALITAAVTYLNERRLALFMQEETAVQQGAEHSKVAEGIDNYWQQLSHPLFVVFQELQVLARTDKELAEALRPAIAEFDSIWQQAVRRVFPDLTQAENHTQANLVTKHLLDGMALNRTLGVNEKLEQLVLDELKAYLIQTYSDVLENLDRETARARTSHES